jgi:redox-sensitive bicupin YhaK (pirin superfamily)
VTYLFDGEILHRDSLGVAQPIRPGDVNWMIAGRGIVHSERTPQALRSEGSSAWGLQSYPSTDLPRSDGDGQQIRIIAGQMFGVRSPVETLSEMFYADATLEANTQLPIAPEHEERGAYIVEGSLSVDGQSFERGRLLVFRPGTQVLLSALSRARVMLLGGEPLGPRYLWWNFVSSSKERIEKAKEDWKAGRFGAVPGDPEFIPLPEERKPGVDYP